MATKAILRERLLRLLSGGDPITNSKWKEEEIELAISAAFGKVANMEVQRNLMRGLGIGAYKITPYKNIPVLQDTDTDEYYSTIPASYLELPNDKGVWSIYSMTDLVNEFIPRGAAGSTSLYSGLEANLVAGHTSYVLKGGKVYYRFRPGQKADNVLMNLIPGIDGYGEDELLPTESEHDILELAKQFFNVQIPMDKTTDQNPDVR